MKSTLLAIVFAVGIHYAAQAQTVPAVTGSTLSQSEATAALAFHNEARKEVNLAPLGWSADLAAYAQTWAQHLASSGCKLEHRPYDGEWKQQHGENIFWSSASQASALEASKNWYAEKKDYTYGPLSNSNWYKTGHYTQIVWGKTTQVGLGKATCPNGAVIIVANYNPAGNMMGEKPY